MMMKESLLLFLTIILLNCLENECRTIQCYSCSHCANSTLSKVNTIQTTNDEDQCMKTTILTKSDFGGEQIVNRGASSRCRSYSSAQIWIVCCSYDLCNA